MRTVRDRKSGQYKTEVHMLLDYNLIDSLKAIKQEDQLTWNDLMLQMYRSWLICQAGNKPENNKQTVYQD